MPKIPTVKTPIVRLKMMYENSRKFIYREPRSSGKGLTLVEMIIALAMMGIVFAAIVPLFGQIRNSWDSKQAAAETLQNGRILVDHLNRTLSKAVRITAVSDASETDGYIEFVDNDANDLRYDVNSTTGYVEYGYVGELYDLAGPASKLQFTCYDACDLDTPITDVNSIRFVKVETTLTNSQAGDQNKTLFASAYLRTNGSSQKEFTKGTPFEYDISLGENPAVMQIDSTHYLCAYSGPGDDGLAVVLTVDTETWDISSQTVFEFDATNGQVPALAQIDSTHYLCAYSGPGDDGWAVVLTVNTDTWSINSETPFEYDDQMGATPALTKIDGSHYLCVYTDKFSDGQAVVLTVDTDTWDITKETPLEYDTTNGETPALIQIDSTHYLCAYNGLDSDGWAVILTVNTGDWSISTETAFEYDDTSGLTPDLAQIDPNDYLCAYVGPASAGYAAVLTVNPDDWTITSGAAFEYESTGATTPNLAQLDPNDYLCAYTGAGNDGWSVVLQPANGQVRP